MDIVTRHIPFEEFPEMMRLDELRMVVNSGFKAGEDSEGVVRLRATNSPQIDQGVTITHTPCGGGASAESAGPAAHGG